MSYPTDASGAIGKASPVGALLGLSPLVVMATSVVDALGLALCAFAALVCTALLIASIRRWINDAVQWAVVMLAIGLCTSTIMLLLQAFAFDVYQRIAFLVPLVITNCFVLARLERASHDPTFVVTSVTAASSATAMLVIVGAACETIGRGTLLAGTEALPGTADLQIRFAESGFLLAATPPGVFIIAGLVLAARNATRHRT